MQLILILKAVNALSYMLDGLIVIGIFKKGLVTVPGNPNDEIAVGTQNSILKQSQISKGRKA